MAKRGLRNLITDVAGLRVGNAEDANARTGVTVLLFDAPAPAVADIRGGAPGTRDVEGLNPISLVDGVDAIAMSGGSAFGNDAVSGVQAWLKAKGRGFEIRPGAPRVPIVPGAILFDLANGGDKNWGDEPPYRALGRRAVENASDDFTLGNAGAGLGAVAGAYKGGLGTASAVTDNEFTVGALVAVNSVGSPLIPGTHIFWASPFEQGGEFGNCGLREPLSLDLGLPSDIKGGVRAGQNTTIGIVATDAALTRVELMRIAIMATDGFAHALRPAHTPFDGDLLFAVSTGKRSIGEPRQFEVMQLGCLAAGCVARAIARGVYEAQSIGELKSYRDMFRRDEHGQA